MTDNSLLADFADETREHLDEVESSLLRLASDPADPELLNTIFRSMHTIKGSSEYLGFARIAQLSHRLENLLDLFRDGSLNADKVAVDLLIEARDRIGDLVAQVEESGQETAQIDDLLDRIASITTDSPAKTVYDGETDTELFDIFMEQLGAGVEQLLETAGQMARGEAVLKATQALSDQVEKLTATANYMGYDALAGIYEEMQTALADFSSSSEAAGEAGVGAFLQSAVIPAVGRIQELFPTADALATLDTADLIVPSVDDASAKPTVEAESPLTPDIAELLADLPAIQDDERASLLSKTLDKTFLSMRSTASDIVDNDDASVDGDPIARQFSSQMEGTEGTTPSSPVEGDRDQALAIFEDFGADSPLVSSSIDDCIHAGQGPRLPADSEVEEDLWPEAQELTLPAPEEPAAERQSPTPMIEFSSSPEVKDRNDDACASDVSNSPSVVRRSIRVDAEKVDDLMNQVGELVVNRSSFRQLFHEMRDLTQYLSHRFPMQKTDKRRISNLADRLKDATTVLGRVSGELQEQVMKVRMLPVSQLFNRYPRLVHDLIKESDKKVQLQFRGEETELDRMVIEQLADPMIHIIRNAVDHGIESVDARKQKGKEQNGVLLLEAYHEGGNVIIEVTDDGKGLDLSRIRQKAVEKQLADQETLVRMDQKALIDFIMLPGFSTMDEVTHTSGRGVGMDVVKRDIEKINGSLAIDTRQDVGTRVRIKIPLTLAIIPALMIHCGGSHFTVPLSAVQETLRIDRGEIFTVDGSEVMDLNEEPLPLIRLTDLLNMSVAPAKAMHDRLFVVVVKSTAGRIGFIVDRLLGRQEVVIKPLEDYLQENSGFCGATILGDGDISLILNVDELVVMAKEREAERKLAAAVL